MLLEISFPLVRSCIKGNFHVGFIQFLTSPTTLAALLPMSTQPLNFSDDFPLSKLCSYYITARSSRVHAHDFDPTKTNYRRCYTAKFVFQPQNNPLEFYCFISYVVIYSNNTEELEKNFAIGPQHGPLLCYILNNNFHDVLSSVNCVSRIFNPRFFHAETDVMEN